jgi:hypothetical protein
MRYSMWRFSGYGSTEYETWVDSQGYSDGICKRLNLCWPQWVYFGSQKHHRTSWNLTEPCGMPWNLMEPHRTLWNPAEPHGILQNLMESYRTSWNPTEPYEIPWKILDHGRIFWLLTDDYKWWHHFLNVCNDGNASVLGGLWLLLLEAFPPRLALVTMPL